MRSVSDGFGPPIIFVAVIGALFWCLSHLYSVPFDNTDTPPNHSGMALYTDGLTGCQYLGGAFGGVSPRLDVNGKQIGCHQ